jgi:hypothetical protein
LAHDHKYEDTFESEGALSSLPSFAPDQALAHTPSIRTRNVMSDSEIPYLVCLKYRNTAGSSAEQRTNSSGQQAAELLRTDRVHSLGWGGLSRAVRVKAQPSEHNLSGDDADVVDNLSEFDSSRSAAAGASEPEANTAAPLFRERRCASGRI